MPWTYSLALKRSARTVAVLKAAHSSPAGIAELASEASNLRPIGAAGDRALRARVLRVALAADDEGGALGRWNGSVYGSVVL